MKNLDSQKCRIAVKTHINLNKKLENLENLENLDLAGGWQLASSPPLLHPSNPPPPTSALPPPRVAFMKNLDFHEKPGISQMQHCCKNTVSVARSSNEQPSYSFYFPTINMSNPITVSVSRSSKLETPLTASAS